MCPAKSPMWIVGQDPPWYTRTCTLVYVNGHECDTPRYLSGQVGQPVVALPFREPWLSQVINSHERSRRFFREWDLRCLCPIDIEQVAKLRGFQVAKYGGDYVLTKPGGRSGF